MQASQAYHKKGEISTGVGDGAFQSFWRIRNEQPYERRMTILMSR
jgi:hypothetical protein